ncbi:hypothetical protein MMMB2_4070 [Mycobacterium marinum MB2]|nr:hypothetical protein MMMB2_4070 [Mycobacterium marinum MB2]
MRRAQPGAAMLSWAPNISSAIMAVQRRYTLPNQSQQVRG